MIQAPLEQSLGAFFRPASSSALLVQLVVVKEPACIVARAPPVAGYVDRNPEPVSSVPSSAATGAAAASEMKTEFAFGAVFCEI